MQNSIPEEVKQILRSGTKDERLYLCSKRFIYFAIYYFPEYFVYKLAPFHYAMGKDMDDLRDGKIPEGLMWVMFRESAKTTLAKIYEIYCICFGLRKYMCIDAYDKDNAEASTFDIAVALQTNPSIIQDFGHLFNEFKSDDEKKRKRISSFITANGIKVEAISTQESVRGKLYKSNRPDYLRLDDFETAKTKNSAAITAQIKVHIDEFKSGLAPDAQLVMLCNLITEAGNVYAVMGENKGNSNFRIRRVDAVMDEQIMWPDKYTLTDDEAAMLNNQITDRKAWKVSLEAKKRSLGQVVYAEEMLNSPQESGDLEFDRATIDELLLKTRPFRTKSSDWQFWELYNPSHRYAIGGDTAKGVGRDSNAAVVIDFSTAPAKQIASYANNRIAPDLFAHELKNVGNDYGTCLVIPEINNTGYATITELKRIYSLDKIYRRKEAGKVIADPASVRGQWLGWETNGANRYEIISQLKSAIQDGKLLILDKRILLEARKFSKLDVENMGHKPDPLITRHFDLLMACALAWVGRDFAEMARKSVYVQPAYEGISDFELSEPTMRGNLSGQIDIGSLNLLDSIIGQTADYDR